MKKMMLIMSVMVVSLQGMGDQLPDFYRQLRSTGEADQRTLTSIPKDQLMVATLPIQDVLNQFGDRKRAKKDEVSFTVSTITPQGAFSNVYIPVAKTMAIVDENKIVNSKSGYSKCDISLLVRPLDSQLYYINKSRQITPISSHCFAVNFLYFCQAGDTAAIKAMINCLKPEEAAGFVAGAGQYLTKQGQSNLDSALEKGMNCFGVTVDTTQIKKELAKIFRNMGEIAARVK